MMQYEFSDDEPELLTLNISNDQYYLPLADRGGYVFEERQPHSAKLSIPKYGSATIRHSLPAYDLWKAFFPTYLSEIKFKNFHRPKLRHYNTGPQAKNRWGFYRSHPVKNLSRHILRVHMQLKNRIIQAINGGMSREDIMSKFLLIKDARELSAKDSELYLFEYCEEHPPVLSQVGMASNIKNYIYRSEAKRNSAKGMKITTANISAQNISDTQVSTKSDVGYDEVIKTERQAKTVYFNTLKPGHMIRFIENNLYRAPIYRHAIPSCDFLVIRTRNSYYIREVNTVFTVGQTLPRTVVPSPNENNILKFRCELSNVYINKLFKASLTDPPSVSLDKLMRLFPDYHKSIVQRRMAHNGVRMSYINREKVLVRGTSNYGLMPMRELRNTLHPEVYCANMSMLAARQRLRELNYTETMIFPDKGQVVELEPEVLAAPWNTTQAVCHAMSNRSYLDLERHLIDPTGPAREGFSCVSWVKSPTEIEQSKEMNNPKNSQPSTLTCGPLKNPLRQKIIQEKLQRLAMYQKKAQLIFSVQSDVLSNKENLSSSEEESDLEVDNENLLESNLSQQVDDLNRLVIGGRTVNQLNHEKEEEERRQLLADLRLNGQQDERQIVADGKCDGFSMASLKNKYLKIIRTYDCNGSKIQRTEIVREPRIIALYVKKKGGSFNDANNGGDSNLCSSQMIDTDKNGNTPTDTSRSQSSLGPSELCRSDGTRILISKKVLEGIRPLRNTRRQSTTN